MKNTDKKQTAEEKKQSVDCNSETAENKQTEDSKKHSDKASESTVKTANDEEENKESESVEDKVDSLKKENADLKDQLLRRAADFDNYRKRMMKEKQDAFDYANTALLKDLLDSLDNFDRTVEAANTAQDAKSIADGVKMINKNLVGILESKYNLVSYGETGDLFDPEEHEAIGSVEGPVAEAQLKEVYLKGYKLKDRVIRHAKVMVVMPDGSVNEEESKKNDSEENK